MYERFYVRSILCPKYLYSRTLCDSRPNLSKVRYVNVFVDEKNVVPTILITIWLQYYHTAYNHCNTFHILLFCTRISAFMVLLIIRTDWNQKSWRDSASNVREDAFINCFRSVISISCLCSLFDSLLFHAALDIFKDTENIKLVFCAVKDTIMQSALKEFNLA